MIKKHPIKLITGPLSYISGNPRTKEYYFLPDQKQKGLPSEYYQHIYVLYKFQIEEDFLSNDNLDPISIGDYFYNHKSDSVRKYDGKNEIQPFYSKIIASSDNTLFNDVDTYCALNGTRKEKAFLPIIPISFMEEFVKVANKKVPISVNVEYEDIEHLPQFEADLKDVFDQIKINSNNEIFISL